MNRREKEEMDSLALEAIPIYLKFISPTIMTLVLTVFVIANDVPILILIVPILLVLSLFIADKMHGQDEKFEGQYFSMFWVVVSLIFIFISFVAVSVPSFTTLYLTLSMVFVIFAYGITLLLIKY